MLYAVLSDVHGNRTALEAVLADAARRYPEAYVCLGDTVGYGPAPNECVEKIRSLGCPVLAGNHDLAAVGALDPEGFSPLAREAIEWTAGVLNAASREWLAALPLRLELPAFLAVHGSPRDPAEEYILDLPTALAVFSEHAFTLCLVGHSHIPGAFVLDADGTVAALRLPLREPLALARTSRYILNAGSVGQPRDGDPRAAYLLLDTAAGTAALHRVRYPVAATQRAMLAQGLPVALAYRLALGR